MHTLERVIASKYRKSYGKFEMNGNLCGGERSITT
jgi:hypothetical protein